MGKSHWLFVKGTRMMLTRILGDLQKNITPLALYRINCSDQTQSNTQLLNQRATSDLRPVVHQRPITHKY